MITGKINRQSIAISGFTSVLTHIASPPSTLYFRGQLPTQRVPAVAIVGSRQPTAYGKEVTYRLAYDLAKKGVIIISGLALGIDAIAHQAALDAKGTTIAVLANGLHRIYPAAHHQLAQHIVANGGALISEQPAGHEARKYDFLSRNRLVSGLADAVVVTEATEKSGTLSTIHHALEQNKEIFAVPGSITSLLSAGPNRLLQQGAYVALNANDILDVIAPTLAGLPPDQVQLPLGDTPEEAMLLQLIQSGVRSGEELLTKSALSASEFSQALSMLELNGVIRSVGGANWVIR